MMSQVEQDAIEVDVLIVGSGPSGMSTALHLVQADAGWAERILVVDKAVHPREKLCGGGVT
ncbi:MAG: FAD-dependent monooxygenase, partial [Chloroflexota bacterium]